ncbi:hypothetical protein DFH08DRAFT_970334 [Mycena albidolilacea]|uniref:Uncharacterized protein n=1 Tax=Mycena albidolilacea TaxID=1033008 RepID=A0AAD6ZFB2_9AGAR|nr:hypothetical protein DFH08DRAFT_970334 [Mycena albidolilacea]
MRHSPLFRLHPATAVVCDLRFDIARCPSSDPYPNTPVSAASLNRALSLLCTLPSWGRKYAASRRPHGARASAPSDPLTSYPERLKSRQIDDAFARIEEALTQSKGSGMRWESFVKTCSPHVLCPGVSFSSSPLRFYAVAPAHRPYRRPQVSPGFFNSAARALAVLVVAHPSAGAAATPVDDRTEEMVVQNLLKFPRRPVCPWACARAEGRMRGVCFRHRPPALLKTCAGAAFSGVFKSGWCGAGAGGVPIRKDLLY